MRAIALTATLLGVALAGTFAYESWVLWEDATVESQRLMGDPAQRAEDIDAAVALQQSHLRDLVVFGDAAFFGLISFLLLRRGSTHIAYLLLAMPAIMAAFLIGLVPTTGVGVAGLIAAFLTFDTAGSLALVDAYRTP